MYYTLCRDYRDPDRPSKENYPSEEWPKLVVSLSSYFSSKLSVSITTDQLARSVLIAGENDSLGER